MQSRGSQLAKQLSQYFFRGLITALPLGLTVYLFFIFLRWTERVAMLMIQPFVGDFYVPGLGLLLGVVAIFLLGFLVSQPAAGKLLSLVELPFTNLPVVKSIYSSLKDFADYFSPQRKRGTQQTVVALKVPGQDRWNWWGWSRASASTTCPRDSCRATAWRCICRWAT